MWKVKVLAQFILSHLPKGERLNYALQKVNNSFSSENIADRILHLVRILEFLSRYVAIEGSIVVEVGTGWEPISTFLFYLFGAETVYTFDHLPHARFKIAQRVVEQIQNQIEEIHSITSIPQSVLSERLMRVKGATNIEEFFALSHTVYKAPADATQTGLADKSVDLVYSYAVLEHVSESVIGQLTLESKRILKLEGMAFHSIGLHDHYANFDHRLSNLNFLKYPEWLWRFFVKNKISYHNRLREKQFLSIFESHGAKIKEVRNKTNQSDLAALKTMKIDKRFAGMTDAELAVHYSEILLSFNHE